jgi:peroxiredoxin Q/BCP
MLREGDVAPDFTVPNQDGEQVTLSGLRGRPVVLYFYPKDGTPGCTIQACSLRDQIGELERRGAVVLGVSGDSVQTHRKFADKFGLPFTLLSDQDHQLGNAYGVWKFKTMFGKQVGYYERTTFVVDAGGRIRKILPRVKPAAHVDLVLAAL